MTASATFKFPSFLGWMLTVRTNTIYLIVPTIVSINCFGQKSKRTACSCKNSGSTAGTGVGLSEDSRSLIQTQTILVFSSSFTHTEYCWSLAKANLVFQLTSIQTCLSPPRTSQSRGSFSSSDDVSLVSQYREQLPWIFIVEAFVT